MISFMIFLLATLLKLFDVMETTDIIVVFEREHHARLLELQAEQTR